MIGMVFIFFIVLWAFIPLTKIPASPPYIMLSILLSFLVFAVMTKVVPNVSFSRGLEHIGRTPLRYWLMMYIVFIIPAIFYIESSGQNFPLHIHWPIGIALSLGLMILLWGISHIIDRTIKKIAMQKK